MSAIKPGDAIVVVKQTRLWPMEMWYSNTEDTTVVVVTPILTPGDMCGIIDTLSDNDDCRVYAALVVCSEGIGCILADAEHFEPA